MNTYIIIAAMILVWLYQVGSMPVQAQQETPFEKVQNPIDHTQIFAEGIRTQFAIDLANRLGNTNPSPDIIRFIVEWTLAEDAGTDAISRNNFLNTTQDGYNENATINSDGVKGYATYNDGLDATVQTLSYGYYTEIVAGIQQNDYTRAYNGLIASPWASSHYEYGAAWPR